MFAMSDTAASTSTPVLRVRGLNVGFRNARGDYVPAAADVDVTVQRGELVALLGESGSGKTVTARAIMGIQDPAAEVSAEVMELGGDDLLAMTDDQRRQIRGERMSMVLQDALSSLNPVLTVGDQITEMIRIHRKVSAKAAWQRTVELLSLVGIPNPEARAKDYPHQFSGGMRQRIQIAMAISLEPELLIADEPTTALDVTVQAQILRLLHRLRRQLDMAVLLITHDIGVVTEVADHLVVMHNAGVVEHGDADEVFANPREPYTQTLLGSAPHPTDPRVLAEEHAEMAVAGPILTAENVSRTFHTGNPFARRSVHAVADVSLELRRGETLAIVGESGSGKSTLARIIVGLESADKGTVTYRGKDVTRRTHGRRPPQNPGLQMVFQDPYTALDPRMRVRDIVAEPLAAARESTPRERQERVAELLTLVGLKPDMMMRFPHQFSGGQRQRIGIARALMRDPDVLVCDEPVSALDVTIQAQVVDLLVGIQERLGVGILFISHDLSVVRNLAHRVMVMYQGQEVETGSVAQIFDDPQADYTINLLDSIPPLSRSERGKIVGDVA